MANPPSDLTSDAAPADTPAPEPSPADLRGLRFLRALVTVLTAVMIVGMVAVVALMAARLSDRSGRAAPVPALPDSLTLPMGATVHAVTAGPGWWIVVTMEGEILVYGADGALTQRLSVDLPTEP